MTSGSKIRIERWCRWLVAALAFTASSAWAFDLPELMGLLARQKNGEARFTEQRFVRGIEGPLDASGTLSFQAPDRLTRRTLTPRGGRSRPGATTGGKDGRGARSSIRPPARE